MAPLCIIIAGPNGAGKTTFAREFLSQEAGVIHFINPDLIASGLSPLRPELAAFEAGRLFLREVDRLARAGKSFAFESTLSGLSYKRRLQSWKAPVIESELSICAFLHRKLHFDASPPGSNKVGTMCRAKMWCAGLPVVGLIFQSTTVF